MSSEIAIQVERVNKRFQIYTEPYDRLKQSIYPRVQRFVGQPPKQYFHEFWAVKNVSFEVKRGETVGIIGRNGSGKSTLLQLICGTLNSTSGSIQTHGRIAALLELGSGFNPEFTGRENVYLNARVLGLSQEETDERFDEIAAFADIGQFIDQQVKTYSSGMMVRLAFAVAINVQPQILIVDEALSVGDELFQRKCFSRIEAIKENGATILFVSHSGSAIVELCDRAILLDSGERLAFGSPKTILGKYQKLLYASDAKRKGIREEIRERDQPGDVSAVGGAETDPPSLPVTVEPEETFDPNLKPQSTLEYESQGAKIDAPQIQTLSGERVNCLQRNKKYRYVYAVRFEKGATNVRFGMLIKTTSGLELGGGVSASDSSESIPYVALNTTIKVEFVFNCTLNSGVYFLNAGVVGTIANEETYLHRILDACMFRVVPVSNSLASGIVDFNCVANISDADLTQETECSVTRL